jgi:NAD(P)-dependent dehydrogenase (short-subunit alcohol dehydrogenase family)
MKRRRVDGAVVVITGATSGVGRAAAHAFARRGCRVGLLARGPDGLAETAREVEELGGAALSLSTDVADAAQVERAAARVERDLGPIDVWVNNAMTTVFAPVHDITPEEYRRATEVTYLGTVWGTMAALRRMRDRGKGVIVQVGSALSYRAIPLQAPYCGAKHAVRGFTDALRSELIHDDVDIHLTMVQLPALDTPQFAWCRAKLPDHPQPVPPIYDPRIAGDAVLWAAEHDRRELSVAFSTAKTILGAKLVPGWLDHYLADAAWDGQMTGEPLDPERQDNLFEPAPGDYGMRGGFATRSRRRSPFTWANERRGVLTAAGIALAAVGVAGWLNGR